jgi:hypothetical protein
MSRERNDMSSRVDFCEIENFGTWRIDVVVDGVVCGHIDRGDGVYRYFEGPLNDVTWSFAEPNLDRLEIYIQATIEASASEAGILIASGPVVAVGERAWT